MNTETVMVEVNPLFSYNQSLHYSDSHLFIFTNEMHSESLGFKNSKVSAMILHGIKELLYKGAFFQTSLHLPSFLYKLVSKYTTYYKILIYLFSHRSFCHVLKQLHLENITCHNVLLWGPFHSGSWRSDD